MVHTLWQVQEICAEGYVHFDQFRKFVLKGTSTLAFSVRLFCHTLKPRFLQLGKFVLYNRVPLAF